MQRVLRSAPWLLAAGAVALVVLGIGYEALDGPNWRIVLAATGVAAAYIGLRFHSMHWSFGVAIAVGGFRVVTLQTYQGEPTTPGGLAGAITTVVVGIALMIVLSLALRFRRGSLDVRDGIDLLTVSIGAALGTWILVTSRLIFVADWNPIVAVADTSYLVLAILLCTFIVDLMQTGLQQNRTMYLLAAAAFANAAGSVVATFEVAGIWNNADDTQYALFGAAFLLMCAGLCHSDAPGTIVPDDSAEPIGAYTSFRLILTGACLVVPGILVATLAPFGSADVAVRAIAMVALVCTVIARLFIAVSSHERANRALTLRLDLDDLTQLPTRVAFVRDVAEKLERTWRSEHQPTIIQLNLDRFKNINDSFGHEEANAVLAIVADRLAATAARFDGTAGRVGGDDFAIVDASTRSSAEAMERLDAVREALREPVRIGDQSVFVTASYGVVTTPRSRTLTAEELMRRADIATHRAKASGRNSVAVFDDSMHSHLAHRMDVENSLHGAIGRQEMRLYHQPIVDITTGAVSGFEALIRWQRDGVIVAPNDFIPIAEETGIICELGAWALHEALSELRGWIDDGVVGPATTISVNVSPRQIADPEFADVVRRALDETGMPPSLLWIEMTESMMLEEPELAQRTLCEIREMGVRIALDDFGTGYSSLSLLQQFPIQRIKIDRAFVSGIADQGNDRSLVRTVIAMAQSMGLDLVAEGVETVHQLQVLNELSCDKAQGFLISRPVPADAMRSTMVALDELTSLSIFGANAETVADPVTSRGASNEPRHAYPVSVGSMSSRPLGQPVL